MRLILMTTLRLIFLSVFLLPLVWIFPARSEPANATVQWKPLAHVQSVIGVTNYLWDGDSLYFSNSQHRIRFYQGRRKSDVNGTTVWLNMPPDGSVTGGDWRLAAVDLDLLQLAVLPQQEGALKKLRVLLDPGHGGDDEGASSPDPAVKEKDLNLALAKKIGAHLKKAGVHVDYTRTGDATLSLDDRSRIARKKKADLFVSIHANHASNTGAAGIETYVLPPSGYPGTAEGSRPRGWQIGNRNDYHNTLLGYSVHAKLVALDLASDRGLKRQSFFVLRETSCPAVLIEFGFLSNHAETLNLQDEAWQEKRAAAVATGICAYAKKVDALDKTVAEKRAREAAANERWKLRLAAKAGAAPAAATQPAIPQPAATLAAVSLAAASLAPISSNAAPVQMASFSPSSAAVSSPTNALAVELDALLDFYSNGKVEQ